jgi:hypothetical protein
MKRQRFTQRLIDGGWKSNGTNARLRASKTTTVERGGDKHKRFPADIKQ